MTSPIGRGTYFLGIMRIHHLHNRYGRTRCYTVHVPPIEERPNRRRWSNQQLIDAVAVSDTISGVLRIVGLSQRGAGNYRTVKHHIERLQLDTTHFLGAGWRHGRPGPKKPLETWLRRGSNANSSILRRRLIRESVMEPRCARCRRTHWEGEPIPLHLEHVDGDHNNNELDNLCVLCANCHNLTPTYALVKHSRRLTQPNYCAVCGTTISHTATWCLVHAATINATRRKESGWRPPTKIDWPSMEELTERLTHQSKRAVALELGVSDHAITKHMKAHQK